MILTEEIFEKAKSSNGGWNRKQLQALGIDNFTKGWRQYILGTDIPEESINKFIALKDCHIKRPSNVVPYVPVATIESRLEAIESKIDTILGFLSKIQ